ncbi:MAG: hypothetical protein K2Q32_07260 [Alphaproteobacteria bacterium]|nr:hypothetical protein [Alphaproteobacteria bacterium]
MSPSSENNSISELNRDKPPKATILGVSGISLTDAEKSFFRYSNPLGFIL